MKPFFITCCLFYFLQVQGISWSLPTTIYNKRCKINTLHAGFNENGEGLVLWNGVHQLVEQIFFSEKNSLLWSDPSERFFDLRGLKILDFSQNSLGNGMLLSVDSSTLDTIYATLYHSNWSERTRLSSPYYFSSKAKGSINTNDNAMAVWVSHNGVHSIIYGAACINGNWTPAFRLSDQHQNASYPKITLDNADNVTILWSENNGTNYRIQSLRFSITEESPPLHSIQTLSSVGVDACFPDIAINSNGTALAVWAEYNAASFTIYSSTFQNNQWSSPVGISDSSYLSQFPNITIDSLGNGCCIWTASDGKNQRIKTALYESGTWKKPTNISTPNKNAYQGKIVSIQNPDSPTKFICLWRELEKNHKALYTSSYEKTDGLIYSKTSWSTPTLLSDSNKTVDSFALSIDEQGNVLTAFESSEGKVTSLEIRTALVE